MNANAIIAVWLSFWWRASWHCSDLIELCLTSPINHSIYQPSHTSIDDNVQRKRVNSVSPPLKILVKCLPSARMVWDDKDGSSQRKPFVRQANNNAFTTHMNGGLWNRLEWNGISNICKCWKWWFNMFRSNCLSYYLSLWWECMPKCMYLRTHKTIKGKKNMMIKLIKFIKIYNKEIYNSYTLLACIYWCQFQFYVKHFSEHVSKMWMTLTTNECMAWLGVGWTTYKRSERKIIGKILSKIMKNTERNYGKYVFRQGNGWDAN